MAAPDEELILSGGTLSDGANTLGTMQAISLRRAGVVETVDAEEYGGEPAKALIMRQLWTCTMVLRNWDADALGRIFLNATGSDITWPHGGSVVPGSDLVSTSAFTLTHSPTDSTKGKGFVLYSAVPMLIDSEMLFSGREDLSILCGFAGYRDGSDRIAQVDV